MIIVEINKKKAVFNIDQWSSNDIATKRILNDLFDTDSVSVSDTYKVSKYNKTIQGVDAVALDTIANLKPEIIEYIPDELPIETTGVVI